MKKILSTILLAGFAFAAQATVFNYENNGFSALETGDTSDLSMSYDNQSDAFTFNLTQYNASKGFDFLYLAISDGPMPVSTDISLWMETDWNWSSAYSSNSWSDINSVSSFDRTLGIDNSYSFTTDLTSTLLNAGNTNGLYGDNVGIWLWGGNRTSHGIKYSSIFDAANLTTTTISVAEPAPLALLMIALVGLFFAKRRNV